MEIGRTAETERVDMLRTHRYREAANLYALDPPAQRLQTREELTKAKSYLLTRARTGAIGLGFFSQDVFLKWLHRSAAVAKPQRRWPT